MTPPPQFFNAPLRHYSRTLGASEETTFDALGSAFYLKEAEYPVEIAFDDGPFMLWDLAIEVNFSRWNFSFKKVRVKNTVAAENRIELYAGFMDLNDRRLNVVESRNGSAAAQVPPLFTEVAHTFDGSGLAVQLVPLDYGRAEIWLFPEPFGSVWFGPTEAIMNGGTATNAARQIGLSLDGCTKLRTKAPVWVRGASGSTVRALVFSF
jgi:hypothetical protein